MDRDKNKKTGMVNQNLTTSIIFSVRWIILSIIHVEVVDSIKLLLLKLNHPGVEFYSHFL